MNSNSKDEVQQALDAQPASSATSEEGQPILDTESMDASTEMEGLGLLGDHEGGGSMVDEHAPMMAVATRRSSTSVLEDIALKTKREHNLECVYVTSDGTAFYTRHDAHNHARNLVDDTIVSIEPLNQESNE